jgi:hypothetical protein
MAERETVRKVHVELSGVDVADFSRDRTQAALKRPKYYLSVELSEKELKLTGSAFVFAVREALRRSLEPNEKILVFMKPVIRVPGSQFVGSMVDPDEIQITAHWEETTNT